MSAISPAIVSEAKQLHYPESDGQPMADNTKQFEWITTIKGNLDALFDHRPDVFVAGDLLWYPREGSNAISTAPDVMVVFGRPKGHRSSYLQWQEGNLAPQVVFEIVSPSNTPIEVTKKFAFYERYAVEEYYLYDPDRNELSGWSRHGERLSPVEEMNGWVSPLLGIRFELSAAELRLYRPDGQPFETFAQIAARAEAERQRAEAEHQIAERLAAQLRALGVEPEA